MLNLLQGLIARKTEWFIQQNHTANLSFDSFELQIESLMEGLN
jgi:hypothetical protein